jgi:F0F1-type ATP synthase epsilon subunit
MTILPEHEPLVTMLQSGIISIDSENGPQEFSIERGYLETRPEQTSILLA